MTSVDALGHRGGICSNTALQEDVFRSTQSSLGLLMPHPIRQTRPQALPPLGGWCLVISSYC